MSRFTDPVYLQTEQYRTSENLNTRITLHERFSTNRYGWHRWVFDQLSIIPTERILELGCGPGTLWVQNQERVPTGLRIMMTDLSVKMLVAAELVLGDGQFSYCLVDAQSIPFKDQSFDVVIANHMLYHVPHRDKALAEIQRVLREEGRFIASTVGLTHLHELNDLVGRFDPDIGLLYNPEVVGFNLEDGYDQLLPWFKQVKLRRYDDALIITESKPLVAYIRSSISGCAIDDTTAVRFSKFVEDELATRGPIHVTKDTGLFIACRDAAV